MDNINIRVNTNTEFHKNGPCALNCWLKDFSNLILSN